MSNTKAKLVIVGGCGRVGLPLGIMFAHRAKLDVTLLDIDQKRMAAVNSGTMPFLEDGADVPLRAVSGKNLHATSDTACLRKADVVITIIGTPVDKHMNPTMNELYRTVDGLIASMRPGALLVLRSTVYPGVTKLVYDRIQARGGKIELAFCPERLAEGKAMEELVTLPQIVSAYKPKALKMATKLFGSIAPSLIELDPLEAELAKLYTNSWRYLNFAVSNQFYMLAESYGLDFQRIHKAVTQDYPRMKSFARAGFAAGPCLVKDTLQLAAFAQNNFFMGHAAMLVNEGLPNFIVERLRKDHDLSKKSVAILGMAFKGDSDDNRESLSYKLWHLLQVYCKETLPTDEFLHDPEFVPLKTAIKKADIIIVGAPHNAYKKLKLPPNKIIVDVWGMFRTADTKTIHPLRTSARKGKK